MTERATTDGGPAFPIEILHEKGMNIRFRTAIAAMQGLLAADRDCEFKPEGLAESAFAIADAMLKHAKETDPKHWMEDDDRPF